MGDLAIRKGVEVLRSYDVPNYQVPERAVARHRGDVAASQLAQHAAGWPSRRSMWTRRR